MKIRRALPEDSFFRAPQLGGSLKKEFYNSLSHIFRGPLMGAAGYVDYLFKGYAGPLTAEQLKQLARVRESIGRLAGVTDAFLDLAAFDLGLIHPACCRSDVRSMLESMAADMAPEARRHFPHHMSGKHDGVSSKPLLLDISIPAKPLFVDMDFHWLQTLLRELSANAVLLAKDKGSISISARPYRGKAEITIFCSASILEPGEKPRLFRPFYRLPERIYPQGGRRGGLGMSLVRRIIALHGGAVKTDWRGKTGFKITLTLNCAPAPCLGKPPRATR